MPLGEKIIYGLAGLLAAGALVTVGVLYWLQSRHYETTDDAYVDGNISQVAAQIGGRVTEAELGQAQAVYSR